MSMFLYNLSLVPPSAITASVIGQFSGTRYQEVAVARGSLLELLRPDAAAGKLVPVHTTDAFGILRSIAAFRVAGSSKDLLVVGSDSGRLAILEYKPEKHQFVQVHLETFGKSGVRRVVPGEYLAVDPKGRAAMLASVEKNKLVYILNRDSNANITISSPLEAHKPFSLVFDVIGLDVGYENPIFAALEVDYREADLDSSGRAYDEVQKMLTYYELDLGLNHVVKSWSDVVDRAASRLFPVPGGTDGPSGVLVCTDGFIVYRHANRPAHRVPIPRRRSPFDDTNRKRSIICGVVHKMKGAFFLLLQTDEGDLFKVTVDYTERGVQAIKMRYFDTVPVAKSLNILKSGFLFVAAEAGAHMFYQFEKLGDDDSEREYSSADYVRGEMSDYAAVHFRPRPLDNLVLVDVIDSLHPVTDCKVDNILGEDTPQIFTVGGQGARSSFRMLRHGLEVSELVASELPGQPTAVWTTKLTAADEYDAYIVLSFTNGTLVLSIGETVEEVSDSGILTSAPTLALQQIGDDSLVQVYPKGIRHISADKEVNEWEVPVHRTIVCASTNARQVVVALSSGEIVYFELDDDGQLNEYQDRKEMTGSVTALSVGDLPEGKVRNSFLAVGCDDSTVRIISLDPENTLESLSVQALTAPSTALRMLAMPDSVTSEATTLLNSSSTLYLHIGLYNGVYLRSVLDPVTGQLSDTQTQFLGPNPVKLFHVPIQGQPAVLALSSRPWLAYTQNVSFQVSPLVYDALEHGHSFSSEQCPEGIVGIEHNNLRIFTVERLTDKIKQDIVPLSYTPRRLSRHPQHPLFYVVQADSGVYSKGAQERRLEMLNGSAEYEELPPEDFGHPRVDGKWASCIDVIDPVQLEKVGRIDFDDNEAAFVAAFSNFYRWQNAHDDDDDEEDDGSQRDPRGERTYLVVGSAKDLTLMPRAVSAGYIAVYELVDRGRGFRLVHKTEVDDVPVSLCEFRGQLLVGSGNCLRLYDMGLKRLLRKAEYRSRSFNNIVSIQTLGNRIIVGDSQQSVTFMTFRPEDSKFLPFVDDMVARHITATTVLDYRTVVGGDRFGNLFIVRCPEKLSEDAEEDHGSNVLNMRPYLDGAPRRLDLLAHFYTQDIPTSVQKAQLVPGGKELIFWSGLQGTLGILVPFVSKEDVSFFQQLEGLMRAHDPPLAGRDHLVYRGYYAPVKSVIDGDLCERFALLPTDKQRIIAGELDRTVREVERKISGMRTRVAF
ncbi:CPSF A subunit region-domain-containing protein [Dipodascopsis tothii]|uniref:CPSF A subunit region-domain-containing protein n=1 Tax=Dipodascopsis tothii TaxID=44089 RepID=UPI0034CE338E